MRRRRVFAGVMCCLILLAIHPLLAQDPQLPSMAGSWELTFSPGTPAAGRVIAPIAGLATFTSDGSMVETDATQVIPMMTASGAAVYGTPGHGIWQPGPAIGNVFIQYTTLIVRHNARLYARKIVTLTGTLDETGSQFSGGYGFELLAPSGRVIATESGRVTGQRMPHPLLP
jgi:hypothetical protein